MFKIQDVAASNNKGQCNRSVVRVLHSRGLRALFKITVKRTAFRGRHCDRWNPTHCQQWSWSQNRNPIQLWHIEASETCYNQQRSQSHCCFRLFPVQVDVITTEPKDVICKCISLLFLILSQFLVLRTVLPLCCHSNIYSCLLCWLK